MKEERWRRVRGISNDSQLLELAKSIGQPVSLRDGTFVKRITPKPTSEALSATLSATYGTGRFPLHTDTAFWPLPSRFLIMRVSGDQRRATTLLPFEHVFQRLSANNESDLKRSVWRVATPDHHFYCSMQFRAGNATGLRYDAHCMRPANPAAIRLSRFIPEILDDSPTIEVEWSADLAIIIPNWYVLHGRGPAPLEERERYLHRIYVS